MSGGSQCANAVAFTSTAEACIPSPVASAPAERARLQEAIVAAGAAWHASLDAIEDVKRKIAEIEAAYGEAGGFDKKFAALQTEQGKLLASLECLLGADEADFANMYA